MELGSDGEPIDGESLGSEDTDEDPYINEDFNDNEDDEVTEEDLLGYYNVLGVQPDATLEVFCLV